MKVLDETLGICSSCLRVTSAKIVENNGKVFLQKNCCNKENVLIDNDAGIYKKLILPFKTEREYIRCGETSNEAIEKIRKKSATTRLTINYKCNLSCPICYLKFKKGKIPFGLSLGHILTIVKENKSNSIVLTGGEPTLRENLPQIIEKISRIKKEVHLNTNGLKLCNRRYLKRLKKAGLKKVYLSFDGFNDEIYKILRGEKLLKIKLEILKNLKNERISTWLIPVIELGLNDNQIPSLIRFVSTNNFIEGIFFLPLFDEKNSKTTQSDILKKIAEEIDGNIEFFAEYKKFRIKAYKLLHKMCDGITKWEFDDLLFDNFPFKFSNQKLKPLILYNQLEEINSMLEEIEFKGKFQTLLILLKNFKKLFKIMNLFFTYFLNKISLSLGNLIRKKTKIIKISIGGILAPSNIDLCRFPVMIDSKRIKYSPNLDSFIC
jgi:uncharacterized radical SAM superfamily Fe-S cluster-containing enzyme